MSLTNMQPPRLTISEANEDGNDSSWNSQQGSCRCVEYESQHSKRNSHCPKILGREQAESVRLSQGEAYREETPCLR